MMNSNSESTATLTQGSAGGEKDGQGRSRVLVESLGLGAREMISLVGAGGKTTLMFRLAKELVSKGKKVITTTTTKILEPSPEESACLLVESDEERIRQFVDARLSLCYHITVTRERIEAGKLRGVSSDCVRALWKKEPIDYMLIEADGAAGRPIKAPREGEPVIPSDTTLVVALLGIDGMGMELREESVFRSERVSRLTGIPMGDRITDEAMAILATHPDGIFKGAPISSRVAVFLNKVDIPHGMERGKRVGQKILDRRHCQIERILLGQLRRDPPVVGILFEQGSGQG